MSVFGNIPLDNSVNLFYFTQVEKNKTDKTIYRRELTRLDIYNSDLIASLYFVLVTVMMTSVLPLALSKPITKLYDL
jgi:hypothetical protein